jgi:hypothetical protein
MLTRSDDRVVFGFITDYVFFFFFFFFCCNMSKSLHFLQPFRTRTQLFTKVMVKIGVYLFFEYFLLSY